MAATRHEVTEAVHVRLSFAAVPEAAPAVRAEVRRLLAGGAFEDRAADCEVAASELVTNAVLHGRAPLEVRLEVGRTRLRVSVRDRSPVVPWVSVLDPTAVTGRGLMLIGALTDAWGVELHDDGKAVWFELHAESSDAAVEQDVDQLLAAWGDELEGDPALERVRIVLTDLPTVLVARSEAHVEGLLRELALQVGAGTAPPEQLRRAASVLQAAAGLDASRVDLRRQLSQALSEGLELVDLTLTVQRDHAEAVRAFSQALDEADRLSRAGLLLMAPAPVELSDARQSYLRRVLAQLAS